MVLDEAWTRNYTASCAKASSAVCPPSVMTCMSMSEARDRSSAVFVCRVQRGRISKNKLVEDWLHRWVIMAPSQVWKYFVKINTSSAKCKSCGVVVKSSGNTVNLWNHIKRRHSDIFENCSGPKRKRSNGEQVTEKSSDNVDEPEPTSEDERFHSTPSSVSSALASTASGNTEMSSVSSSLPHTPTERSQSSTLKIHSLPKSFERARSFSSSGHMTSVLNEALMFMVVKDGLPLNFVEGIGFRYFTKKAVPLYKAPSRKTFTAMIDEKYKVLKGRVCTLFSEINEFNLTADIWTDKYTTQSYLGVTVHYLNGWEMVSTTIGITPLNASHDAQYISQIFGEICADWNINVKKVQHVVTDNAANIVAAAKETFGSSKHIGCFAHTLNLVVEKAIDLTPELRPLIDKVKAIVTFFKQSVSASDQLKTIQLKNGRTEGNVLKLVQSVSTRWNSTFLMFDRFIELSDILGTILLKYQNVNMLTGNELSILKEVCRVLKPVYNATVELSAERYTTVSKIIPMMNLMKQLLSQMEFTDNATAIAGVLNQQLIKQIDRRFEHMEYVDSFAISTLLDPRFKKIHFCERTAHARAVTKVSTMVIGKQQEDRRVAQEIPSPELHSTDPDCLWSLHDAMVASSSIIGEIDNPGGISGELRLYLNSALSPRNVNPLQTWENLKQAYPHVYLIARSYLSRVATSVPAERLFSKAGATATEVRSRLTKKHLSELIFLSSLDETIFFST